MGFWRDPKRKHWTYNFRYLGKWHGGRGFKTKAEARAAREDHRKRLKAEQEIEKTRTGTAFSTVINAYLDESKRRHADKTYRNKKSRYKSFLKYFKADPDIESITTPIVNDYLKTRPTNNNFNVHRKDLHALFKFAVDEEILAKNPVTKIEPMPHTAKRKVIPTEQQVLQLIMAADPVEERPLLMVILNTLGRVDEVLRLTWDDINFEKRSIVLWTRKRKGGAYESDVMAMNRDLYDVLFSLYKGRNIKSPYVFVNPKTGTRYVRRPKMMAGLCRRAFDPGCDSIKKYTGPRFGFHHLRHFVASLLADSKKFSLKTMQKMLRHKEARTTEIYLHEIGDGKKEAAHELEGRFTPEKSKTILRKTSQTSS
jgi:integrase